MSDERIDKVLDYYKDGQTRYFFDSITNIFGEDGPEFIAAHELMFKELVELGLLERQQVIAAVITTFGKSIIDNYGGWLRYKEAQSTYRKNQLAAAKEKENKTENRETFRFWITIVASLGAGFLGGLVPFLMQSNKPLPVKVTGQIDSLRTVTDTLNHKVETMDGRIYELSQRIDSISTSPELKK